MHSKWRDPRALHVENTAVNSSRVARSVGEDYIEYEMIPRDGVPWQPPQLDEYLSEPFEEIERKQGSYVLTRLDEMQRQLEDLEQELEAMLLENTQCS